jgi:osmotically-inducible protein OsmY
MAHELDLQLSTLDKLAESAKLPPLDRKVVEAAVGGALQRVEQIDAKKISIKIEGDCVFLQGVVKTWREHEAAAKTAAGVAGVTKVQNELRVAPWMF